MYPFNWPFSMAFAKLGVPLLIKIEVERDEEAGVYIATSPNVRGFNIEAETLDEIKKEVELVLPEFLSIKHGNGNNHSNDSRTCLQFNTPLHA